MRYRHPYPVSLAPRWKRKPRFTFLRMYGLDIFLILAALAAVIVAVLSI